MKNLSRRTTGQLFEDYAAILDELRRRGILRSGNHPIADYAERLVCEALNLIRAPASTKGYDAFDTAGHRYEIKGRRPTASNPSLQLSAIRDLNGRHFEFLVIVLFTSDFSIARAAVLPVAIVEAVASFTQHTNSWRLIARNSLFQQPQALDITAKVRAAPSCAR